MAEWARETAAPRLPRVTAERAHIQEHLVARAREIRILTLAAIYHAGSGHPGGSLSCAEILAALYGAELNVHPGNQTHPDRDRFILSKGHAAPALYAAGAAAGLMPREFLFGLRKLGSPLQGHPHVGDLAWVETSTGSLGQGISVAVGMALGLKHQGRGPRVFALMGDGEQQEGEVWEAAMCAAHHGLNNLCAIIDRNGLQSDAPTEQIIRIEPLAAKWRAFGWQVREIDGHDFGDILDAFRCAEDTTEQPTVILAQTIKGKGVDFMENAPDWHGSVKLSSNDLERALTALGCSAKEIKGICDGRLG